MLHTLEIKEEAGTKLASHKQNRDEIDSDFIPVAYCLLLMGENLRPHRILSQVNSQ